jgi:hypothetical protein
MPVLAAVIVGAVLVSGCGQAHVGVGSAAPSAGSSGGSSGGSGSLSGQSASGSQLAACHGSRSASPVHSVTISATDNGKTYCLPRGATLTVFLKGTPTRKWEPIRASSAVLKPTANGELALALGVTGASFMAAKAGTAVISSAQPACSRGVPPANGSPVANSSGGGASSGGASGGSSMSCTAMLGFHVTVTVTG